MNNHPRLAATSLPGAGPLRRQRPGAVLVVTLLAVILIAALLGYIINLGRQTNSRIVTQNAADATAICGAGWVARTLNTVAMNNVSMARLVSLVNVLDSMPQAVDFTLKDQQAVYNALEDQLAGSAGRTAISTLADKDRWLLTAIDGSAGNITLKNLDPLFPAIKQEVDLLTPVDKALNHGTFDMREMTYYTTPTGARGQIWLAMESLDQFSQAMVDNVAVLAQTNAALAGMCNTGQTGQLQFGEQMSQLSESGASLLLPATPAIPFVRGAFDDFHRPVANGLLPVGLDDKTTNRGPYDTIFGWRAPVGGGVTGGYWVSTGSTIAQGGHGSVPVGVGHGASSSGHWEGGVPNPNAYTVYGPHGWLLRQLSGIQHDQLRHSRFGGWSGQMASIKLGYLWPGGDIKQLVDPNWLTTLEAMYKAGDDKPGTIVETCFAAAELKSRYPRDNPQFLSPGSYALDQPNNRWTPRVVRVPGWVDPRKWTAPQIGKGIWRDEWAYTVFFDNDLGISQQVDPVTKQPIPQPVYRIDMFILVGVNVGTKVDVRSPHNFVDKSLLPAPISADASLLKNNADARRQYLTFMGVSARHDRGLMWPSRFGGGKMEPADFSVAEAKIFNDHSWDLWTQMWRVQLQPVSDFPGWTAQVDAAAAGPADGMLISADVLERIQKYLHSVEGLAPAMLAH